MKLAPGSQTDWEAVKRRYDEDAPIPFDDEDRAEGLYDPNNEAEVDEFFRHATIIGPMDGSQDGVARKRVSLELPQDIVDFYRAKDNGLRDAIEEALRKSMGGMNA